MKIYFLKLSLVALLMVLGSQAFAAKVVVFDHKLAIMDTDKARKKIDSLQKSGEYKKLLSQVENIKEELQDLMKEAESKGMTWGEDKANKHRRSIDNKRADFQLAAKKIKAEQGVVINNLMQEMAPKLEKILQDHIKSEGIDVVLQRQAAYYSVPSVDITPNITAKLNAAK